MITFKVVFFNQNKLYPGNCINLRAIWYHFLINTMKYAYRRITFYLLISASFLSMPVFGQYTLKGMVRDSLHKRPIANAMVFIDGTTKGTVTDNTGRFLLEDIPLPSLLVASHISYQPGHIMIDGHTRDLTIFLNEQNLKLTEITVVNTNMRQANIKEFSRWFLGEDFWGRRAVIKNDSVLAFQRIKIPVEKTSDKTGQSEKSNLPDDMSLFYATSNQPLKVDMPLLGYNLYVILKDFMVRSYGNQCMSTCLGYYYYQPYNATQQRNNKYNRNRRSAYYNSSQHFCRSLYNGSLAQNGYRIIKSTARGNNYEPHQLIDLNSFLLPPSDNQRMIVGLKGKKYRILYYHKLKGSPLDLTAHPEGILFKVSAIRFLQDTCFIRSDGSIPDNAVVFSGELSLKKAGASLPDDYVNK